MNPSDNNSTAVFIKSVTSSAVGSGDNLFGRGGLAATEVIG